jgi:hypothetical protein
VNCARIWDVQFTRSDLPTTIKLESFSVHLDWYTNDTILALCVLRQR